MKKSLTVVIALLLGAVLAISVASPAYAQDQPAKKVKVNLDRIHGVVQSINKETSTISVKENKTGMIRQIVYSDATKFTKVNKPGASLEEVKEGTRIICLGKFDEKSRLDAARIDIRLPK